MFAGQNPEALAVGMLLMTSQGFLPFQRRAGIRSRNKNITLQVESLIHGPVIRCSVVKVGSSHLFSIN